jgi:hypothetical protein
MLAQASVRLYDGTGTGTGTGNAVRARAQQPGAVERRTASPASCKAVPRGRVSGKCSGCASPRGLLSSSAAGRRASATGLTAFFSAGWLAGLTQA